MFFAQRNQFKPSNTCFYLSKCWNSKNISVSENSSCLDDKLHFVLEASRRSNTTCLQLYTKEIEAYPGESAAASIISRNVNNQGSFQLTFNDKVSYSLIFRTSATFVFHIHYE